jgi:hypothetical protein
MSYIFPTSSATKIAFKLGIAGTSMSPEKVEVVLEKDGKSCGYIATLEGEEYVADINPKDNFTTGKIKLYIQVIINGRVFKPFKTDAEIIDIEVDRIEINIPEVPTEIQDVKVVTTDVPETTAISQDIPITSINTTESLGTIKPKHKKSILKQIQNDKEKIIEKKVKEKKKIDDFVEVLKTGLEKAVHNPITTEHKPVSILKDIVK